MSMHWNGKSGSECNAPGHGSPNNKFCGICIHADVYNGGPTLADMHSAANTLAGMAERGELLAKPLGAVREFDGTVTNYPGAVNTVGAVRDDAGKTRYDLIPAVPLHELAKVYTGGAVKYAPRNWEKGMAYSRIWGSMMRHAWAFWRGETNDQESGLHHMAHVAFGCFALIEYMRTGKGDDDRPLVRESNEGCI